MDNDTAAMVVVVVLIMTTGISWRTKDRIAPIILLDYDNTTSGGGGGVNNDERDFKTESKRESHL